MAVGDGFDARPHVSAEKVHVLDVAGSVLCHHRTEAIIAINNILIIIIIII